MRIVCVGHVNWDVTLHVDAIPTPHREATVQDRRTSCGGSAANVAVGLAGLDVSVGLVGSVGTDMPGAHARQTLGDAGVDTTGIRVVDADTAVKYVIVDQSGTVLMLGEEGTNETICPTDLDAGFLTRADHLHLTGYRPDTAGQAAAVADQAGLTVSFDPGRRAHDREFADVLPHVDLLFATDREAAAFGEADVPRVVVRTRGEDGAVVETETGTTASSGYNVEAVDTAGAGDAFAAGFLACWVEDGDIDRALETANACGALAAREPGAQIELAWDAIRRFRHSD